MQMEIGRTKDNNNNFVKHLNARNIWLAGQVEKEDKTTMLTETVVPADTEGAMQQWQQVELKILRMLRHACVLLILETKATG